MTWVRTRDGQVDARSIVSVRVETRYPGRLMGIAWGVGLMLASPLVWVGSLLMETPAVWMYPVLFLGGGMALLVHGITRGPRYEVLATAGGREHALGLYDTSDEAHRAITMLGR